MAWVLCNTVVELASLDSFWNANEKWISAAITLLLAIALAILVDRAFAHRAHRLAQTVTRGGLSREADTRLRFVQRLIYATILLIGLALALSQFTGVNRIAASVLASGVVSFHTLLSVVTMPVVVSIAQLFA